MSSRPRTSRDKIPAPPTKESPAQMLARAQAQAEHSRQLAIAAQKAASEAERVAQEAEQEIQDRQRQMEEEAKKKAEEARKAEEAKKQAMAKKKATSAQKGKGKGREDEDEEEEDVVRVGGSRIRRHVVDSEDEQPGRRLLLRFLEILTGI
jgi:hypothetical protein